MSATGLVSLLALQLIGQDPLPTRQTIDPYLPASLFPTVTAAAQAELDARRGSGNAIATLKAERAKRQLPDELMALDLRVAGVVLRQRFLTDKKFPEPLRWEQAISTFSRLDLAEPELKTWLDRAIANHPFAKKELAKKNKRVLKAALLLRGEGFDKKKAEAAFRKPIAALGFDLQFVPAKEASLILKLAAEDAVSEVPDQRAVRVLLGLESLQDGKVVWHQSLFRTTKAKESSVALEAALEWMTRVGGRDLFFRWLGEHAFPSLVAGLGPPSGDDQEHGRPQGSFRVQGKSDPRALETQANAPGKDDPRAKPVTPK